MKRTYRLVHTEARQRAAQDCMNAPDGYCVTVSEPTRSLDQNARLWASLTDVSEQVVWHGKKLDAEDWKTIFTASLKQLQVVPNLTGTGFVALGQSTSKMTKSEFSDLLELIYAFGAERDVVFGDMEVV